MATGTIIYNSSYFLTDWVGYKTPSTKTVALLLITSTKPP